MDRLANAQVADWCRQRYNPIDEMLKLANEVQASRRLLADLRSGYGMLAPFKYRCSVGHWVRSSDPNLVPDDKDEIPCPAMFGNPLTPCDGTIGDPMVDWWQVLRLIDEAGL